MPDFDLAQLRALAAVLDEGTFEAAAVSLRVTPSAVSQRIKALEVAVGRVLLVRTKPVTATEAGTVLLRLARQVELLSHAASVEFAAEAGPFRLPIAVNADSMASWLLPALAPLTAECSFELYRADQARTSDLLRAGTVVAAITAEASPPPGCGSDLLGRMRYRPMATEAFRRRWFPDGVNADALARSPVVVFDRDDELQHRYLRSKSRRALAPPTHYIPASADFLRAIAMGFGWGMVPDVQLAASPEPAGELVVLDAKARLSVVLYWQQWKLATPAVDQVAVTVRAAARRALS